MIIYISGPYSADTEEGIKENIRRASEVALRAWEKGWTVICPHKNTAGFHNHDSLTYDDWMRGNIEMLLKCDAILMMDGWTDSMGALREYGIASAYWNPLKVFYLRDDVPECNISDNHQ